jgi:lipopolysaccharide exporter
MTTPVAPGTETPSHAPIERAGLLSKWLRPSRRALVSEYTLTGMGTTTARALSFLTVAIMGRLLGPEEFGRFSLAFYIMTLLPQLSTAIDNALIKHAAADARQRREFLSAAVLIKLAMHGAILLVGLALAKPVVRSLLQKEHFQTLYVVALVGGAIIAFFNLVLVYEQAQQHFRSYVAWSLSVNALILLGVVVLIALGVRDALSNLLCICGVTLGAVACWWPRTVPRLVLDAVKTQTRELLHFGAWIGVATIVDALHQRLDVFVLGRYGDFAVLGTYAAAVRVSSIVDLFQRVVMVVLYPRAMAAVDDKGLRDFFKEAAIITGLAMAAGAVTVVLAGPLLHVLFGQQFGDALAPARLLCVANLALLVYTTVSFVFYILGRPEFIAALGLCKLVAAVVLAIILVPRMGANGAAWTMLGSSFLVLVVATVWAIHYLRKVDWKNWSKA